MAGAYAHLTLARLASERVTQDADNYDVQAVQAVERYPEYVSLGSVSPDLPYLGGEAEWADTMHHENTGAFIKFTADKIKKMENSNDKQQLFGWLLGFASHVAGDTTIHPVVNLRVGGGYDKFPKEHRECEMSQDVYIFRRLNLGELGVGEYIDVNIAQHHNDKKELDPSIERLWQESLRNIYPEYFAENKPDVGRWFWGFKTLVDKAEELTQFKETNGLFALTRHVLHKTSYDYPSKPDLSFIEKLNTPHGMMHYDDVFERALQNVLALWHALSKYVFQNDEAVLNILAEWNLDTGETPDGLMAMWRG